MEIHRSSNLNFDYPPKLTGPQDLLTIKLACWSSRKFKGRYLQSLSENDPFCVVFNPHLQKVFFVACLLKGVVISLDFCNKASNLYDFGTRGSRYGAPLSINAKNVPVAFHLTSQ